MRFEYRAGSGFVVDKQRSAMNDIKNSRVFSIHAAPLDKRPWYVDPVLRLTITIGLKFAHPLPVFLSSANQVSPLGDEGPTDALTQPWKPNIPIDAVALLIRRMR
jgi:hypothetical protein